APSRAAGSYVAADGARLPFVAGAFDLIVSNHSLEHFVELEATVREIGRVLRSGGGLFVAVPDATTLTDRIYRWLGKGGGHVNAFTDGATLAADIQHATGLEHVATRTLCSSLSFLNRCTAPRPLPRRLWLLGGGYPWTLFIYVWLSRRVFRRASIYGWAFYFGNIPETIETATLNNVCIQCGA